MDTQAIEAETARRHADADAWREAAIAAARKAEIAAFQRWQSEIAWRLRRTK